VAVGVVGTLRVNSRGHGAAGFPCAACGELRQLVPVSAPGVLRPSNGAYFTAEQLSRDAPRCNACVIQLKPAAAKLSREEGGARTEHWSKCPKDAPFPALEGKGAWRLSEEVTQRKSFGKFVCEPCQKSWRSAHAFKAPESQQCQACNGKVLAKWRWLTTAWDPRSSRDEDEDEERKPHHEARCSVCVRLGHPCRYDSRDEDEDEERKPHQEARCSVCVRLGHPCWFDSAPASSWGGDEEGEERKPHQEAPCIMCVRLGYLCVAHD